MGFWRQVGKLAARWGYELVPVRPRTHPRARRARLLEVLGVDLVLDVGANRGQYGAMLRASGYRGRIVSYEPLAAAFEALRWRAAGSPPWEVVREGVGEREAELDIHVAGNEESSSLLEMLPRHVESAPRSAYAGVERVKVVPLSTVLDRHARPGDRLMVKLDVQGYEGRILEASPGVFARAVAAELELSLVPLYAGAPHAEELIARLRGLGLVLASFETAHADPSTGQLLQLDGLFVREG